MIKLATASDIRYVAQHMREQDRREVAASIGAKSPEETARIMAKHMVHQEAYCWYADGEPAAVVCYTRQSDVAINCAFFATDRLPSIGKEVHLGIMRQLRYHIRCGIRRLWALAFDCGCIDDVLRWLTRLGWTVEGRHPHHGVHGETAYTVAWVDGDGTPWRSA